MKLSIVIPIYNASQYIVRCLDSVLSQNCDFEYEVICVNDGSKDDSEKILRDYSAEHSTVRVITTVNQGAFLARKTGLEAARGEWVGFVDCDDIVAPDMYGRMMSAASEQEKTDLVVCGFNKINGSTGQIVSSHMNCFGDAFFDFTINPEERGSMAVVNPALWNKIFRREVALKGISLEKPPRIMEDFIFFVSVIHDIRAVAFVQQPLYDYYDTEGSATKTEGREELLAAEEGLIQLARYLEGRSIFKDVFKKNLVNVMVTVHLGIAFSINYTKFEPGENVRTVWSDTRQFLDRHYSGWKDNPYVKLKYVKKHNQLIKLYVSSKLYAVSIWPAMVAVYHLVCKILGKDLKW